MLQTAHLTSQTGQASLPLRLDDDEAMSDDDEFEEALESVPAPSSHQLASTMGLDTHRLQVMKASFFGSQEDQPPTIPAVYSTGKSKPPLGARLGPSLAAFQRQAPPQALLRKDMFPKTSTSTGVSLSGLPNFTERVEDSSYLQAPPRKELSTSFGQDSLLQPHRYQPSHSFPVRPTLTAQAQSAVLMAKHDLHTLVPLEKSIMQGKQRCIADMGLFLGRSFRVGWGPNWTLAHSGTQISVESHSDSTSLRPRFTPLIATDRERSISENQPLRVVIEKVYVSPFARPEALKDRSFAVSESVYRPLSLKLTLNAFFFP